MHEVKAMAAKLRARAEAVKSEISATAEECVKRIVSRKQEILARVNYSITMVLERVILRLSVSVLENKQLIMFIGFQFQNHVLLSFLSMSGTQ